VDPRFGKIAGAVFFPGLAGKSEQHRLFMNTCGTFCAFHVTDRPCCRIALHASGAIGNIEYNRRDRISQFACPWWISYSGSRALGEMYERHTRNVQSYSMAPVGQMEQICKE